jgi:hypothetical protein
MMINLWFAFLLAYFCTSKVDMFRSLYFFFVSFSRCFFCLSLFTSFQIEFVTGAEQRFSKPRKSGRGVKLTTHLHLVPRLRMRGAVPPLSQYVLMVWCLVMHKDNFNFTWSSSSFWPVFARLKLIFCVFRCPLFFFVSFLSVFVYFFSEWIRNCERTEAPENLETNYN